MRSAENEAPTDAAQRRAAPPVVVYGKLPQCDRAFYQQVRRDMVKISETIVPPREARTFSVPAGSFKRNP